jgi:hypothetical protein
MGSTLLMAAGLCIGVIGRRSEAAVFVDLIEVICSDEAKLLLSRLEFLHHIG